MMRKTTCGKDVHVVGFGVCGQLIVQVKVRPATKKDHDAWRLGRIPRKKTIVMYGKEGTRFKLK